MSAFELYLRTGLRAPPASRVEVKFNPWHDPDDGRFTFAGMGNYFPAAADSADAAGSRDHGRSAPKDATRQRPKQAPFRGGGGSFGGAGATGDFSPQNSRPTSRPAAERVIERPTSRSAHPSVQSRPIVRRPAPNWRRVSKNAYEYQIDHVGRTRRVRGQLTLESAERRSKRLQAEAGGGDRRATDDGGHYIAVRFNGPREAFNHFAQDANFNRGAYRVLEDNWAKDVGAGRRVYVDITPHYVGASTRPTSLTVIWYVDGHRYETGFANERKGKRNGGR